jgi:phosphoribosylanthranilate isomerase
MRIARAFCFSPCLGWVYLEHGLSEATLKNFRVLDRYNKTMRQDRKMWVKVCGITTAEDAESAMNWGADALGFVFYSKSPRAVDARELQLILGSGRTDAARVALFVNPTREEVERILETGLIDRLQFHGDEDQEFCNSFGMPQIQASRVRDSKSIEDAFRKYETAEMILLDADSRLGMGGTGETFDWDLTGVLSDCQLRKTILAGGLTESNVVEAITTVRPFGVDVSSGVEVSAGKKDLLKMKRFIEGVKSV